MKTSNLILISILMLSLSGCQYLEGTDVGDSIFINYADPREDYNISNNETIEPIVELNESTTVVKITAQDTFVIGSFNVQIFGKSKAQNKPVLTAIKDIINDYDIIAIQEIRDISGTVVSELQSIPGYSAICSERLGRSTSKEQYCYVYRTNTVALGEYGTYPDLNDDFEREPFLANFGLNNFTFTMGVIHVKPSDAVNEISALKDVVDYSLTRYRDSDIIMTGDLNMDCSYHDGVALTQYTWKIGDNVDTTTSSTTCAYDRVFTYRPTHNLINCGVDDLQDNVGNNTELLRAVSDHFPIRCDVVVK